MDLKQYLAITKKIGARGFVVLALLMLSTDPLSISYEEMEKVTGLSTETLRRIMRRMKSLGLISVERTEGRGYDGNRYSLNRSALDNMIEVIRAEAKAKEDSLEAQNEPDEGLDSWQDAWEPPQDAPVPDEPQPILEAKLETEPEQVEKEPDISDFDEPLLTLDAQLRRGDYEQSEFLRFLESRMLVHVKSPTYRKITKGEGLDWARLRKFDLFSLGAVVELYTAAMDQEKARIARNEDIARSYTVRLT